MRWRIGCFNPCFRRPFCNTKQKLMPLLTLKSFNPCFLRPFCNVDRDCVFRLSGIVSIFVFLDPFATKCYRYERLRRGCVSILVFLDPFATCSSESNGQGHESFNPCFRRPLLQLFRNGNLGVWGTLFQSLFS